MTRSGTCSNTRSSSSIVPSTEHACNQVNQTRCPHYQSQDLTQLPPAMAYVPWQYFGTVYEIDKALICGTIFPELSLPFCGKRGASPR